MHSSIESYNAHILLLSDHIISVFFPAATEHIFLRRDPGLLTDECHLVESNSIHVYAKHLFKDVIKSYRSLMDIFED